MSEKNTFARSEAFGRATGAVYWYAVLELAFVLASLPGLIGFVMLEPAPGNIPFFALCIVPIVPAFSAALAALRARARADDLDPWRQFWKRWRQNVQDVLVVAVPALAVLAVFGFNAAFASESVFAIAALVLGVLLVLWLVHAVVIASLFTFRARDTARLALYYLVARPLVTLGVASLAVLATAVVFMVSPILLLLAASVFAGLVLANARRMIADIEARFIALA